MGPVSRTGAGMSSQRQRRARWWVVFAVIGTFLVQPAAALAIPADEPEDPGISWAIQPSSAAGPDGRDAMVYTLTQGETVTDYVGVSNLGDETLTVQVYPMDAHMTSDGAFSLPPAGVAPTGLGGWIGLSGDGTYTIEPGTRVDIPFLLTIPENASPGDHAAGIVASVVSAAGTDGAAPQMSVDRRVGVRLYLNIPGDALPGVDVSDVVIEHEAGWSLDAPAHVSFTVTNTGNVRVHGTAALNMAGPFGAALSQPVTIDLPDLLPGARVTLQHTFDDVATAGLLKADVTLTPTSTQGAIDGTHRAHGSVLSIPWLIVSVTALVAAALALFVARSIRLRRRLTAAEAALAAQTKSQTLDEPLLHPAS